MGQWWLCQHSSQQPQHISAPPSASFVSACVCFYFSSLLLFNHVALPRSRSQKMFIKLSRKLITTVRQLTATDGDIYYSKQSQSVGKNLIGINAWKRKAQCAVALIQWEEELRLSCVKGFGVMKQWCKIWFVLWGSCDLCRFPTVTSQCQSGPFMLQPRGPAKQMMTFRPHIHRTKVHI